MAAMPIDKMLRLTSLLTELLVYLLFAGIIVILCLRALRSSCHQKSFNWKMFLRVWLCLAGSHAVLMNVGNLPGPCMALSLLLNLPGLWCCFVMFASWHAIAIGGFIANDELADYGDFLAMTAGLVSSLFWATAAGYCFRHKMARPTRAKPLPVLDHPADA